jgi:outer membrane lipoprotein-sorting protein
MPLKWRWAPLAALAVVTLSLDRVATADLFDEIYARGRPIEASLKTLTAAFVEESTSSLLARPLVARGTLAVVRPHRIVLHYVEPERRTVLIDGDTMRMVWPARSIDQRLPIGATQRRIQQYFADKSPAQLRSHFDITAAAPPERPAAWRVTMVPRRKQIREGLSRLELWIDRETVMVSSLSMTFPNGDTKTMSFEAVRVNPAIDDSVFTPAAP